MLRLAPIVAIGILIGPVAAGLVFVLGPAFGHAFLLRRHEPSLAAFQAVFAEPGIWKSIWLGFWLGPATALISLGVVVLFTAAFSGTRLFGAGLALVRPVIAVPHAAAAAGLAFLFAPSGFLIRLVSPELTGFTRPPDWLVINDPQGLALLAGLVAKEIPFLFLVLIAALPQAGQERVPVARSLGYGRVWAWTVTVFPAVYAQIRWPVYAVIAFAGSVVDMALILGPGTPPLLSVRILRWFNDPDLTMRLTAAAAALVQLAVTLLALFVWWLFERAAGRIGLLFVLRGTRLRRDRPLRVAAAIAALLPVGAVLCGIAVLALWSVAGIWRFPEALPRTFTPETWMREAGMLWQVSARAAVIAAVASLAALVIIAACLENEYRRDIRLSRWARLTLYLPLLVPQIAFLTGLSVWLLWQGWDGGIWAVIFAHMVFVMPYTYLVLSDSWHSFDTRYLLTARLLGKSQNAALFNIRLPILLRPLLTAFALGFAISVAQYLPTLLAGAGRQPTVTTEAVALAAGGDRRLAGAYALAQTLLPFAGFALTALIPALLWRNRRALQPGAGR